MVPAVAVFTVEGLQVPLIPFTEVPGKVGAAAPTHTGVMAVKVGTMVLVITTEIVAGFAHCPASGVKV